MTRVVSVTSMAVERDSRTFKFAASAARLGYESIVVEGEPSALPAGGLPFRLISPEQAVAPPGIEDGVLTSPPRPSRLSQLARPLPEGAKRTWRRVLRWTQGARYLLATSYRDYRARNRQTSELLPDAEVYWLHSFFQFPAVYGRARRLGARFLYDTPDAYWEPGQTVVGDDRVSKTLARIYEKLERQAARRSETFTSVSDGVAGLLERRFGRRPQVIRNFHDIRLDQTPQRGIREVTGVAAEDFLAVMTGNLKAGHTVEAALLAMRELPERVHLAFVGRGHQGSAPRVAELGLSERVHLLDPLPPTEVVDFIRSADASPILYRAISTNYLHSLPNGFFHAIAAGLPVLYPPLPEIRALASRHELGVEIDPENHRSVAAGIRALSEDPEALARYRDNSEKARQVLSWEKEEARLAAILAGIV